MDSVQAQFRSIYEETNKPVFNLVRTRVASRDDALDILQEVYIDFWKALKRGKFVYRSNPELLGFLYLIARRKIARFYLFRRFTLSLDDLEPREDPAESDQREILFALRKLGNTDREVLDLRYFSGLSFGEIASLLDKNENAIKVRHHRAMRKLKDILGYEETS